MTMERNEARFRRDIGSQLFRPITRAVGILRSTREALLRSNLRSRPYPVSITSLPRLEHFHSVAQPGGSSNANEDARKRSLAVCLDAIYHIAKMPDIHELYFVRANFANIGIMKTLWCDVDTAIRVKSRSICALIARRVGRRELLNEEELRWLQDVIGETPHEILNADFVTRDRMNFKSFIYGVFSYQMPDLPTEDATCFTETLAILLDVRTDPHFALLSSQNHLVEEVGRIVRDDDDPYNSRNVVNGLSSMFPFIPPLLPSSPT